MRTLRAAINPFAEHGVGATSSQMIADVLEVTICAVYQRFNAKDEIIIAVTQMELMRLRLAYVASVAR